MWRSRATAIQTGHVKVPAVVDTNMFLEVEQSTQVQTVITSGKQHRSFHCVLKGGNRLVSVVCVITYTAFGFGNLLGFSSFLTLIFILDYLIYQNL